MPKLCATVRAHASFLSFASVKRVSTRVCLHACVKFILSCTIELLGLLYYTIMNIKDIYKWMQFFDCPRSQLITMLGVAITISLVSYCTFMTVSSYLSN